MSKSKKQLAIEAKRAYMKKWRAENKDKVKQYNEKYWLKQAAQLKGSNHDSQCNSK